MAKKDLSTTDWRPDDDLDFNFDNEIGTKMSQESSKSRSAVASVAAGIGDGLKSKATDPSLYKRILRATLPKHYGEIADATSDVTGGLYELYDQTQKEVKPRLNRLTKSLDKFIPEESKTLKKLMGKIVDLTGGDESRMTSPDTSAQEDQNVNMMLGEIFKAQHSASKIGETRAIMRDAIESKRYKGNMDISARMQRDISILQQYTTNVTQAFQKKSLELQLRSYLGQRAYHTKSLEYMEIFRKQNEAIVKNSSLPDAVKITETERLKTIGKEKLMGSLYGEGSTWKKGFDRLKKSASGYVQGMGMRMDMAEMGIDMAHMGMEQMKEMNAMLADMGLPPMTKSQMAGAAAAGWIVDEASDWASPKLKAAIEKHPEIGEKLARYARFAMNPGSKIKKLRNSEEWKTKAESHDLEGKMYKFFDFILEHFEDRAEGSSYVTGNTNDELAEGKGFDKRAYASLTTVIPGYLSMIHREMSSLRAGKDLPYYRYDFQSGRFRTDKALQAQSINKLKEVAKSSGYAGNLYQAREELLKDQNASSEEKDALTKFLSKLSRVSNLDYTLKDIQATDLYKNLSSSDQEIVDKFFSFMEEAPDKEVRQADFSKSMLDVRNKTPDYQRTLTDIIRSGHGDLLLKEGILKRSEDGFTADPDDLHRFTEEHAGTVGSDMNIKEDTKATTPAGLLKSLGKNAYEGIQKTKLYNWMYKKGAGDRRPHAGPMAQDVQKNLGDEAAPGGKEIDLQTMNGSFFASIQYLGSRIEDLFKGKEKGITKESGDSTLKNIDLNVARIAAMTAASSGGLGGGTGYREGFSLDYFLDKGIAGAKSAGESISKGASTASNKIAELWGNNKDKLKDKAIYLFNKGSELAGSIFDAGSQFLKNTVPEWMNRAKDFGKKVMNTIGEQFMVFQDLYLPDGTEPVIRAAKLKAGEYYDEISGKAITTMDEVLKAKGAIVDKAGNIIVSTKELSRGLVDKYGEKAKTMAGTAAAFAISGVKKIGASLMKAGGQLTEMVAGGFSKVKEWWDNSPEFKFPDLGAAFIGKKHLAELINIRDILLGDAKNVRKRIKKSAIGKGGGGAATDGNDTAGGAFSSLKEKAADIQARYAKSGSPLANLLERAKGYGGKAAAMATVATRGADFTGPMTRDEMEAAAILEAKKAQVGGRFSNIKDYAQKLLGRKGPDESFVGPMQQSRWGKLRDRAAGGLSKGKSRLGGLLTMASGFLSGDKNNPSPGALTDGSDGQTDQQKEAAAHDASAPAVVRRKRGTVAQKDRAQGDDDGDGVKDSSVEAQRNKVEALRAERDKKTLAADTSSKYKSSENVLDTIAKKASDLIGTLTSGLGSVFNLAGMLFSGGKGIARGVMGAFGALGKGAAALGAATGGPGAGFGTVVRGAMLGARAYGAAAMLTTGAAATGIVGFAGLALSSATAVAGTVLAALSTATVAVPLVVAAAAAGLYYLYKRANRNNASEMERLRLRQYGFAYNTAVDRYNHHVYMLEEYLQDGRISYDTNGYPSILNKKVNIKDLLSIFEIDEKDSEGVGMFNDWFRNRFKPIFFAHLAALLKVDKKKTLQEVNDLKPEQKLTYLEQSKFKNGPYNYSSSPFGEKLAMDVNSDEIMTSYDNLILKVMTEIKKTAKKHAGIAKPVEEVNTKLPNKTGDKDQKVAGLKAGQENAKANQGIVGQDALGEGDGAAPKSGDSSKQNNSGPGSINMAGGPMLSGENGMQFINLKAGSRLDGLSPSMLRQFLAMAEEYGQLTGKTIPVESGFRSYEQQKALWMRDPKKAAKPGRSLHEYGLALDIGSKVANELDQLGLMKKYGFTRPVGGEPWHIEPAGIQKSLDLAKSNAEERERMIQVSAGRGGGGFGAMDGSPMGRRNHDLAMKLLDVPSKLVQNKSEESKDVAKASADNQIAKEEGKSTSVTPSSIKNASNDASYSKSSALPTTKMADYNSQSNQTTVSPDAESGKAEGGSNSTGSSSGIGQIIEDAARKTGMSADLLKTFAAVESSMDPSARSKNSSAMGLMQFMPDTWKETLAKYGGKYGLASNTSPFDASASALMGAEYIKSNQRILSGVKPNMNAADMYLTHLLGAGGARKFFQADPSQMSDEVLGSQARSNPELFFANGKALTIGQAYDRIKQRIKAKADAFGLKADLSGPGLKAPATGASSQGMKVPSSGGIEPKVSGPEPTAAPDLKTKRGFNFDSTSAGYVSQPNQSGQRNDTPSSKVEALMEKSNDTANESLKALQSIVSSLSEERLTKVLAAVVSMLPKQESKEEAIKVKDKENMGRTATARGSSLDLMRRTSA